MLDAGGATDRCSRWSTTDTVSRGSSRDVKDDTCTGGWGAMSTAAVYHTRQAPQSGNNDPSTETSCQFISITWLSRVCFCHAMVCISEACAVTQCLPVCPSVTFVHSGETNKLIFVIFSQSGIHTILVFPHQTLWQYSVGVPLTGGGRSNEGGVGKNRDSRPIIIFIMYVPVPPKMPSAKNSRDLV